MNYTIELDLQSAPGVDLEPGEVIHIVNPVLDNWRAKGALSFREAYRLNMYMDPKLAVNVCVIVRASA